MNIMIFVRPIRKTPWMTCKLVIYDSLKCVTFCVIEACASSQSNDSVSASLRMSLGSTSILVKILLFRHFQRYHKIHANWWSSNTDDPCWQKAIEKIICLDSMRSLRESKLGPLENKKKICEFYIINFIIIKNNV